MKLWLVSLLVLCTAASPSLATDWNAAVRYWYYGNVSTNVPPTMQIVTMTGNDNASVDIAWKITPHPTRQDLIALEPAAIAWQTAADKERKADLEEVTPEVLKAVVAGIVKAYNAKLPAQYRVTAAEVRQAIKESLP